MRAMFLVAVLGALLTGCTQQGGMGGGFKGTEQGGQDRSMNPTSGNTNVSQTGSPTGTITPAGERSENTADGSKK